jgi:hypothetical protein
MTSFLQAGVVSKVFAFFEIRDLCLLDATSKDMQVSMAAFEGRPHAWIEAAKHQGFSFPQDANKKAIKEVFAQLRTLVLKLRPRTLHLHTGKGVKEFIQAAQHMKNLRLQHLRDGGQIAEMFLIRFRFDPESVAEYVADPSKPVFSREEIMAVGSRSSIILEVELGYHRGKVLLATEVYCHEEDSDRALFKPFSIQLRTVSSPLTVWKTFNIWREQQEQEGTGLCFMSQTSSQFTDMLSKDGILCMGLTCDLLYDTLVDSPTMRVVPPISSNSACDGGLFSTSGGMPAQNLNALHLDMPRLLRAK